jgi:hypothetical protein
MKLITLTDKPDRYKLFEVVELNRERWIVTEAKVTYNSTIYTLEPLLDFIARHQVLDVDTQKMTIAELLQSLEEEFINTTTKEAKG